MLTPSFSHRFKKERSRYAQSGKKNILNAIDDAIDALLASDEAPLDAYYQDHPLEGQFNDCRDIHVGFDIVIVYRISGNTLELLRVGGHSELFEQKGKL
jgi:mRNA interferase YafQ